MIWIPVAGFFLVSAAMRGAGAAAIIGGIAIGLVLWTFSEYMLHRFLFHFPAKGKTMERIIFLFHGVHHYQPAAKTRLVMPPVVSIPLASLFYLAFHLVIGLLIGAPLWVGPVFAGFLFGYLAYDLIHYATHHFAMRRGYWKFIKRYHMAHHYKNPDALYGVSNPLWDYVFRTEIKV